MKSPHVMPSGVHAMRIRRPGFIAPIAQASATGGTGIDVKRCMREASERGYRVIGGVDEAGAGALAGPLVCAAVTIRGAGSLSHEWLGDSKKLSQKRRRAVHNFLLSDARIEIGVAYVSAAEIDRVNILQARKRGLAAAVNSLAEFPDFLFVDGNFTLPLADVPLQRQRAVVGGDALVAVVSAASIVAKETRDAFMRDVVHCRFPQYGFDRHMAYPTVVHRQRLAVIGPCAEHRVSFRPVRDALAARLGGL